MTDQDQLDLIVRREDRQLLRTDGLAARGLQDIARFAAASNATLIVRDDDIHDAAAKGDLDRLRSILDSEPGMVDFRDHDDWTPLHTAVCHDQPLAVSFLIQRGADVHARLKLGDRRIHEAGGCRQRFLFDSGNYSGASPLHLAALLGRHDCAEVLLAAGADIQLTDDDNLHALQYAAMSGRRLFGNDGSYSVPVAELLVTYGADVNHRSSDYGDTLLHIAVRFGNHAMADWLITRGMDVNVRDCERRTPLHDATLADSAGMVELLLEHHADADAVGILQLDYRCQGTPLLLAAYLGANESAAALLRWGASPDTTEDTGGSAPLHWAARACNSNLVEMLIEAGANVDATDHSGHTPLHHVALSLTYPEDWSENPLNTFKLLLANGADVNARDMVGRTPLDLVQRRGEEEHCEETVHLLQQFGARSSPEEPDTPNPGALPLDHE